MMHQGDYVRLAAGFRATEPAYGRQVNSFQRACWSGWVRAMWATMNVLKADNPLFDRDRFLEAASRDAERVRVHHEFGVKVEHARGLVA